MPVICFYSENLMNSTDQEIGCMPRSHSQSVTKYSIASVFGLYFGKKMYKLSTEQTFLLYLIYIFVLVWTHAYADWLWKTFVKVFDSEWYNISLNISNTNFSLTSSLFPNFPPFNNPYSKKKKKSMKVNFIACFSFVLDFFFMIFPPKPGNPSQVTRNSQFHLELVHNTTSNLRVLIASLKPSRPLQNCWKAYWG